MSRFKTNSIRIIFTSFFTFLLIFSLSSNVSAKSITTYVNAKKVNFTNSPLTENGRTLVEFRPIFEALGLETEWNNSTKTIVGKNSNVKIQLTLGSKTAFVNGKKIALEVAPKTIKGRTLVPLRFISDSTGSEILWHSNVSEIDIYSKNFIGEKRTPTKSLKAARGTNWNMSPNEVMKIEKAKLLVSGKDGDFQVLKYYPVDKYGYKTELTYYFKNHSLMMIVYDFFEGQKPYYSWSEMGTIHDKLHKLATEEYGQGVFITDDINSLWTKWDLGSSDLLLSVDDKNIYTTAQLIFYRK